MLQVRIGLIYSLTGTMAITEKGQYKAALLAINELNNKPNAKIEYVPVVKDIQSDSKQTKIEAERLLKDEKVDLLVGIWTSSARKEVLPLLQETDKLLFYTAVYEGMECDPNVFYCGRIPNQQSVMLSWAMENLGPNFYLVGNDYIYPRSTIHQLVKQIKKMHGNIVGIKFVPYGCSQHQNVLTKIKKLSRQSNLSVVPVLVGSSISTFYQQYKESNIQCPIISPVTSESEISTVGFTAAAGHYCASSYFESLETPENKRFVEAFKQAYGEGPISADMEVSYNAIHLLDEALNRININGKAINTHDLRQCLKNLSIKAPQGRIIVDGNTQHLWLWSRIGRITDDGKIQTIWSYPGPIQPDPYAGSRFDRTFTPYLDKDRELIFCTTNIIGESKAILDKLRIAKIASKNSANVLITGESGTGKELFARAIHDNSERKNKPFIPINCASIPRELIASELFGYEEGTFTGAKSGGKIGLFESAEGGTVFLDEIGEMPIDLQANLLRVLQEREVLRIGGVRPIPIDVRIIAATNKDLLNSDVFRKDLYYRLNVFQIDLPKLQDRIEDIPRLTYHFLHRLNIRNKTSKTINLEVINIFVQYPWPGNIRELSNVIERSYYMSANCEVILPEHLPEMIVKQCKLPREISENELFTLELDLETLDELERIKKGLLVSGGNITKAAKILDLSRSTLYRKIKRYELKVPSEDDIKYFISSIKQ